MRVINLAFNVRDNAGSSRDEKKSARSRGLETMRHKLDDSPLINHLLAEGATLIEDEQVPDKQVQQLYGSQFVYTEDQKMTGLPLWDSSLRKIGTPGLL